MNIKHEISCWQCNEMTSLETRNEFDGYCWACGVEIDLEDYLIKAMDKRDEHYAALSAVTAERDALREDRDSQQRVCIAEMEKVNQLRAEVEMLREDAGRYRWLAKRDRWASLLVDFDRHSTYRRHRVVFFTGDDWPQVEGQTIDEAVDAAMAAKEE